MKFGISGHLHHLRSLCITMYLLYCLRPLLFRLGGKVGGGQVFQFDDVAVLHFGIVHLVW